MGLNLSTRTQAIVLLLLVATSGALAGVVGDRLLHDRAATPTAWQPPPGDGPVAGPWRWEARPDARYGERLASTLDLTGAQRSAIDSIVDEQQDRVEALTREIQPQFRAIAEETRSSIEHVLTPEQRDRLRLLREQRMRAMGPGMGPMMRGEAGRRPGPGQAPGPGGEDAAMRGPGNGAAGGAMRRPGRSIDDLPPALREGLRDARFWEFLDSIRGDRPLWEVRDSLLRARGDTAAADRLRARRDSIAARMGRPGRP
jgi:Spy/CpxP family protein refolding chaperone